MREITFRGKRVDNGEWVEGEIIFKIMEGVRDENPSMHCKIPNEKFGQFIDVIPETVGQFTGLLDNNGSMIFEGDICNVEGFYTSIVYQNKTMAAFMLDSKRKYKDGTFCSIGFEETQPSEMEIIGNIHDNPELIK